MRGARATRHLRLLQLLESRRDGVEIDEAASELGTGRRTVYRDFEVLQDTGVPLVSEQDGRRARWKLMEGYRHRLQLALSWSELLGLQVAAELTRGLAGSVFHDAARAALEKIRATLPRPLAEKVKALAGVASTPEGGHDYRERGGIVRVLVEAIDDRRTVAAAYRSRSGGGQKRSERLLDPYHLRVTADAIYLVAWCHRSEAIKTFLVDRFQAARLTDATYERRANFVPDEYLRDSFGEWHGRVRKVRFRVSDAIGSLFLESKLHRTQVAQKRSDGSVEVQLDVPIVPPLVSRLVGFGPDLLEVHPPELASEIDRQHRAAISDRTRVRS